MISSIQNVLQCWGNKFKTNQVNYASVILCASYNKSLNSLSDVVCLLNLIPDIYDIKCVKDIFHSKLNILTSSLLKSSRHSKDKSCLLHKLLLEHYVQIPEDILNFIEEKLTYSTNEKMLSNGEVIQLYIKVGNYVAYLHEDCTLKELMEICFKLEEFQKPLLKHLDMLVFFSLENSILFCSYLNKHRQFGCEESNSLDLSFRYSLYSIDSESDLFVSGDAFCKLLEHTKQSIHDVLLGKTTYSEMISCTNNDSMFKEVTILEKYVICFRLPEEFQQGWKDVESMLQLFQYSPYIISLYEICKTFEAFKDLYNDLDSKPLFDIAVEMKTKMSKELTTAQAKKKLQTVKMILGLGEGLECLEIFQAIAKSKEFYNFLYYQQFVGKDGHIRFKQKYDLITAQLQHQEYNENVLNHLLVAYTLMVPFLKPTGLKQLIQEIQPFIKGINQLKTVNSNLTQIRIWFLKAEV